MEPKKLWQAVLGELEVSVSRANFSTWFKHTAIMAQEDGHVVVAVPNIFTKDWLENKYHTDIKTILERLQPDIRSVEYKVSSQTAPDTPLAKNSVVDIQAPITNPTAAEPQAVISRPTNLAPASLNNRYTFESFVVGASNELAYAACLAVAKSPGAKYNPLFIYGGVGLGKTHLMQAIGNEIRRREPSSAIEYVTSEQFTNEFLSSISSKKTKKFAEKYRNVDVLIVDDIQFLGNKERTQEEFFHTFNTLHQQNKQIIMSSDKSPQAIPNLEDRLKSRFASGMSVDIQKPDLETRSAIIQRKAEAQGINLSASVVELLARHSQNNIRELEGTLTNFIGLCEMRGLEPNTETVNSLLGNLQVGRNRRRLASPKAVIEKTAAYFDLLPADIIGSRRDKDIVVPRQIAMYLMRHELGLSFPKIASCVGGRDHTTAMHSVTKIEKMIEVDDGLRLSS
jgi:chromosomal replication initiator protein